METIAAIRSDDERMEQNKFDDGKKSCEVEKNRQREIISLDLN